jgi:hypothetical protein
MKSKEEISDRVMMGDRQFYPSETAEVGNNVVGT